MWFVSTYTFLNTNKLPSTLSTIFFVRLKKSPEFSKSRLESLQHCCFSEMTKNLFCRDIRKHQDIVKTLKIKTEIFSVKVKSLNWRNFIGF